jgi:RNA polymerase sigma factor (sigma-70 family)
MHFPTTSKTLINHLPAGDEISWEQFFSKYADPIRELGNLKGLTPEECDDLVQEVMCRFLRRSKTFRFDPSIARFRTFFSRMICGIIVDIKRRRQKISGLTEDFIIQNTNEQNQMPDEILDEALLIQWKQLVKDAIMTKLRKHVSALHYSIFEMYVLHNNSCSATADFFGVSKARVYLVKNRCMMKLKKFYRETAKNNPELELYPDEF